LIPELNENFEPHGQGFTLIKDKALARKTINDEEAYIYRHRYYISIGAVDVRDHYWCVRKIKFPPCAPPIAQLLSFEELMKELPPRNQKLFLKGN
jgi:hypothetical protein